MNTYPRGDRIPARVAIPLVVALCFVAALSLFASRAAAKKSEVVTLTLVARDAHAGALNAAIARFEQLHPDIKIRGSYLSNAATATSILNGLTSGSGPDIVVMSTSGGPTAGLPSIWAFGPRSLVDLSDRPWVKHLWRPLLPLVSVAGKIYGQPINTGSIQFLVYNKDLFAQLGLKLPTTWGSLLALCNQIADQGKVVPIKLAGATAVQAGSIATMLAANAVYTTDPHWSAKRNAGKVTFAGTPGWRQAFNLLADMRGARCFDPSPATVTNAAANAAFNSGQAAMTVVSGWDVINGIQEANPSLNIGFLPLPGASVKSTRVMVNPGEYLAVNASSPARRQAVEFLDFVGSAWPGVAIANAENSLSSLNMVKGVVPEKLSHFAPFIKAGQFVVTPLIWANNPTAVAVFRAGVTSLLAGTKTIDQVLAEMDAAW